jgi:hypothetical protein
LSIGENREKVKKKTVQGYDGWKTDREANGMKRGKSGIKPEEKRLRAAIKMPM